MTEFVTHAFSAGVMAPAFFGRTDLDKYDLGLAEAENFYIDYTGGIKNRAGTRFLAIINFGSPVRFHTYVTAEGEPDLLLVFTASRLTIYVEGTPAGFSGMTYDFSTPYTPPMLEKLSFAQRGTKLTITVDDVAPRVLQPNSDIPDLLQLVTPAFVPGGNPPNWRPAVASSTGSSAVVAVVTSVNKDGVESRGNRPFLITNIVNYTTTEGSLTLRWDPVPGAVSYRVYRSVVAPSTNMTISQEVGFIGEVVAPTLVDANIIPDFSRQPPQYFNPFADGAILSIDVVNEGSGYTDKNDATASIAAGSGAGSIIYPVIENSKVVGAILQNPGFSYTAPRDVTISGGGGTGALLRITAVSPPSGNKPAAVEYFQQRQVFASSKNLRNFIWGTDVGAFFNFSARPQPRATDAYIIGMDSNTNTAIKHIMPIRDGLLLFHGRGVDRLRAQEGNAISPLDNVIEPQAAFGVGQTPPIFINNDVLYVTKRGTSLHALSYTFYTNSYTPQDLSTLASHLLGPGREPVRLVWQEEPDKILWVVLSDGSMLSLTYFREQEVFAWATHRTSGFIYDAALVVENEQDKLYLAVRRTLGGQTRTYLEVMETRDAPTVEFSWFVDCGLQTELNYPDNNLFVREGVNEEGQATAQLDYLPDFFEVDDVVRVFGGVLRVVSIDGGLYECLVVEALQPSIQRPTTLRIAGSGEWSWATPTTTVGGLAHLNNQRVSVLADGDAFLDVLVEGGSITLSNPATLITVGLPYEAYAKTLPLSEPQTQTDGKKKRIVGTAVRLDQTRGLAFGSKLSKMYEMKDRGFEDWGQITRLRSDNSMIRHAARWERDASLHILQRYPLPATVLGLVTEAEVAAL